MIRVRALVLGILVGAVACESAHERAQREAAEREAEVYSAAAARYDDDAKRSEDELVVITLRNLREARAALKANLEGMKDGSIVSSGPDEVARTERRLVDADAAFKTQLATAKERRQRLVDLRDEAQAELAKKGVPRSKKEVLEHRVKGIDDVMKQLDAELKLSAE